MIHVNFSVSPSSSLQPIVLVFGALLKSVKEGFGGCLPLQTCVHGILYVSRIRSINGSKGTDLVLLRKRGCTGTFWEQRAVLGIL